MFLVQTFYKYCVGVRDQEGIFVNVGRQMTVLVKKRFLTYICMAFNKNKKKDINVWWVIQMNIFLSIRKELRGYICISTVKILSSGAENHHFRRGITWRVPA